MANAAADEFYAGRGTTSTSTTESVTKVISPTIQITIMGTGAGSTGLTPSERQELVDEIVAAMSDM